MKFLLLLLAALACSGCATAPTTAAIAIVGATIYPAPDAAPIPDGVVILRGTKIEAVGTQAAVKVPPGSRLVLAEGLFLVAGFQNSHVHFMEPKWIGAASIPADVLAAQLREFSLRWGFTTVVDIGSFLENTVALRDRIEKGGVPGPRILTAGIPFYPVDGIPYYLKDGALPPELLAKLHTPGSADEAAALARTQFLAGADAVKLFTGSGQGRGIVKLMEPRIARGASDEAHKARKPVFSHASNAAGLDVAIESNVDVIAHALDDVSGWNGGSIARMRAKDMAMVPTLKLFGQLDGIQEIQREVLEYARAGGQILFGTDVGFIPDYDTTAEFSLMASAGLSWQEILASLTTAPASRFGESAVRGRVAVGLEGDLLLLGADPAKDARNFANVRRIFRAGQELSLKK